MPIFNAAVNSTNKAFEVAVETLFYRGVTQRLDAFNEASAQTMLLTNGANEGRFPQTTEHYSTPNMVSRRDTTTNAAPTPTNPVNKVRQRVNVFRKIRQNIIHQEWRDQKFTPAQGAALEARKAQVATLQNSLNTGVSALVGAIQAMHDVTNADAVYTPSPIAPMSYDVLNEAAGLASDHRDWLRGVVHNGKTNLQLIRDINAKQTISFQTGGTTIYTGGIPSMNLAQIKTDAPPLYVDSTTPANQRNWSLFLFEGAIIIRMSAFDSQFVTPLSENNTRIWSLDWHLEIDVRGMSYTGSGINPDDAALANKANWTVVAEGPMNQKHGPGVASYTNNA